jgi:hypothetical protein
MQGISIVLGISVLKENMMCFPDAKVDTRNIMTAHEV